MKFVTITAILFATLIAPLASQAKPAPPTRACLHSLAWQRWNYTKAHYNVVQSLQEKTPDRNRWTHPLSNRQCLVSLRQSRKLQRGESAHWNRLHLSRAGVKWIIRRQFRSQGRQVVLNAWQVASCESGFRWNIISHTGDYGVWQINQVHNEPLSVTFSPEKSTAWAWRASDHGHNFSPTWKCATLRGID